MLPMLFSILLPLSLAVHIDPKGYVMYCPCMGRFGNQLDQTIGVLSFARNIDRTLVLPNFIEFKHPKTEMIPFEHIFQLEAVKKLHRVVTTSEFVQHIAPKIWPKEKRKVFCWNPRASIYDKSASPGCHAKEGNPFGPYWDKIGVDFVGDEYFGSLPGGYDLEARGARSAWLEKYNATEYPVLAFSSAPAHFPSRSKVWENQRYLRWGSRVLGRAKQFIKDELTRPFVGVHLRNNNDWNSVCEHIDTHENKPLFASAQCLGENHHLGVLQKEMCLPSAATVVEDIVTEVGKIGARSVFVTSDLDHMLVEINDALKPYDIQAYRLSTEDPYVALAILGQADHFIGNCVSTFSHIVKRERDYAKIPRTSSYFGQKIEKRRLEL